PACIHSCQNNSCCLSRRVQVFHETGRVRRVWINESTHTPQVRNHASQKLKLFWRGVIGGTRQSSRIPSGSSEAVDKPISNRIIRYPHHNRNRLSQSLRRPNGHRCS